MKTIRTLLSVFLLLSLALALCACGGQPAAETASAPAASLDSITDKLPESPAPTEDYSGEYTAVCARFSLAYVAAAAGFEGPLPDVDDQYVDYPTIAGSTVTLNSDGSGYLDFGEDNRGPIDSWSVDGSTLRFQAGVSDFEGSLENGVMTLTIDDGFALCLALPDADVSAMHIVPLEDMISLLLPAEPEYPAEGEYTMFAILREGYLVDSADLDMVSTLILDEGGTGFMSFNEDSMDVSSWVLDGEDLSITVSDGGSAGGTLRDGVLILDIEGNGESLLYYAQEGVDLSSFAVMSLDEVLAAMAAAESAG